MRRSGGCCATRHPPCRHQRADDAFELGFGLAPRGSVLRHLFQQAPLRVLFPAPEPGDPPLAALVKCSIAMAPMGDPNASIPTPQPVHYRPMFAGFGRALAPCAVTFTSKAALRHGIAERLGLARPLLAVENTRGGIGKRDMVLNDALPRIEVDPETYEVRADGELLVCEPARVPPLAQRYFLF
jgi:urease alpha subunit